jgi:enoyl-[acyl-carrier protein] reductase I
VGIAKRRASPGRRPSIFGKWGPSWRSPYYNDKAKPYVAPLAESVAAPILVPCNVSVPDEAHLERKEYVVLLKDRFFIANRAETG